MDNDITLPSLREFIVKFRASLDPRVWLTFMEEEHQELLDELEAQPIDRTKVLKEATDLMYVTVGFNLVASGPEQLGLFSDEEHAEIRTKLTEFTETHERAIEILGNVNYVEAFRRVHNSNMSKLGNDGKPIYREDGKVLKGPNYKEPKLGDIATLVIW